jgi:hypothetical protein
MPVSASSATTFNVSVTTSSETVASRFILNGIRLSGFFVVTFLGVLLPANAASNKRVALRTLLIASFLTLVLGSSIGCNGSGGSPNPNPTGTPAGTYNLLVTATSGSMSQSVSLTLKVQ